MKQYQMVLISLVVLITGCGTTTSLDTTSMQKYLTDYQTEHHAQWKKTLAPLGTVPKKLKKANGITTGYGWTISDGRLKED